MKAKTDQEACDMLDSLVIASPCSVPWDAMQGDDRKRLCCGCSKNVFNISDMSKKEAQSFLLENGTTQCMIFRRRFDGTIITDDCPVGLRKIRNACRAVYRAAASFVVLLLAAPGGMAQGTTAGATRSNSKGSNSGTSFPSNMNYVEDVGQRKPAPAGYEYWNNPAGGGMILRPVSSTPKNEPPILSPGRAIAPTSISPSPKPKTGSDSCASPDILIKKKPASTPPQMMMPGAPAVIRSTAEPPVSTVPDPHPNLDSTAHVFYEKGQAAQRSGNKQMANFYYEKALDAYDHQKAGDPRFRAELQRAIEGSK